MIFRRSEVFALGVLSLAIALLIWSHNHLELRVNYSRFAFEYGNIAAAVARGDGFSDPFELGTGPTAWMPPLYVYLMALVFVLFGIKTKASLLALIVLKVCGLVASAALLLLSARRYSLPMRHCSLVLVFGAALLGNLQWLTGQLFDHWLLILASSMVLASLAQADSKIVPWTALVLPWISPNLGLGLGLVLWRRRPLVLLLLALSAGLWILRNWLVLGVPYPIKSNAGYEFYQANAFTCGRLSAVTLMRFHPSQPGTAARREYFELGEAQFCQSYRHKSLQLLRDQPVKMASQILSRACDAFLYLRPSENTYLSSPDVGPHDKALLHEKKLIHGKRRYQIWLTIDLTEEEMKRILDDLPLRNRERALQSWRNGRTWARRYSETWPRKVWGVCFAFIPGLAIVVGILRGGWRVPAFAGPVVIYVVYLLPYVLISHYSRYQLSALALQVWLVWLVFVAGCPWRSRQDLANHDP